MSYSYTFLTINHKNTFAMKTPLYRSVAGLTLGLSVGYGIAAATEHDGEWTVDFFDDFDRFEEANWQDQILWVNDEDHCYVRDGLHGTREVSDGSLKLRVVDLGEAQSCDNVNKSGETHPDTAFVAGRIASKNRPSNNIAKPTLRTSPSGMQQPNASMPHLPVSLLTKTSWMLSMRKPFRLVPS